MTATDLGPAELITLIFPGERAHPDMAEVLIELAAGRDIDVLDLAFVTRTADNLVQITRAGEDAYDVGLGAVRTSAPKLISDEDLGPALDWLRPGTSAVVIAYEHSWARRLGRAVSNCGGIVMLSRSSSRLAEEQRAVAESEAAAREAEAAVRQAEAEAAAARRAAERYSCLSAYPDLVSRLASLARLRESGMLSAAEFEEATAKLLAS
jgi:uncharacterized protein DUF6325